MNKDQIEHLLRDSISELYVKDHILLTKDYDIHERTVAHRLAIYIEKRFSEYDVDIEYNRMRDRYGPDMLAMLLGKELLGKISKMKTTTGLFILTLLYIKEIKEKTSLR